MSEGPRTSLRLTDEEVVVLDGRCSPETQTKVDAAKARLAARERYPDLTPAQAGLVADVVSEARERGELRFWRERVDYCRLCRKSAGYAVYKSGPRAGEPNHKKPLTLPGYEFAYRFVRVARHVTVGGCADCVEPVLPAVREALRGVPAQVPDALRADGEPERVRHERRRCPECGWEGHEGQMGRLPALLDGTYPGKCPSCGWEHQPFGKRFEALDGFVVETVADEREAVR